MPHLEGREVGGCKLIRKIGAGGMGEVYLGEQIRVGNRSVAVKIVSPEDMTFHPEAANDIARRFEREAAILGNLSHPNILPVHDSGMQDGMLYLVMEYAPDGSLADALRGGGTHTLVLPLSVPFALDLVSQVAAALEYTHQRGIVHRDVKPGNVLIRVEPNGHWHVLLADFGVARSLDVDSQRTQVSGTFIYMAPEQFSAKFSPASDQYALAVMTFQLLAGRPPFDGDLATLTRAHMYEPPPSLHAINPAVPVAIDAVLARALAKDPAQRYPTVAQFAAALRSAAGIADETTDPGGETAIATAKAPAQTGAVAAGSPGLWPAESPTNAERAQKRSSPWRWLATGLFGLLLIALLVGGEQYLTKHTGQTSAIATATVTTLPTATPDRSPTAIPSPTVPTIATLAPCTAALSVSDDANCIPPPPSSVQGTPVLSDSSPGCDTSRTAWTPYNNTTRKCSNVDGTELTATTTGELGCLEAQQNTTTDGYASVFVTQGTGSPVLAFRQDLVPAGSGGTEFSTGYFFEVSAQNDTFTVYRIDSSNVSTTIVPGAGIPGQLAAHYVMSVLYSGNTFTFYINGQSVGTASDTNTPAISSGWYGLCVDGGTASFRAAQEFPSGS
ncbi:MAG: protein kinase domain-containing protein [Ktedonobacterales bacterium]